VKTDCQQTISLHSPAKINLFLAITHLRKDGYHNLLSLAAPLAFGDELEISLTSDNNDCLICENPHVPTGENNLIFKAIKKYREVAPFAQGVTIKLNKKIPMGAGLGGGSSNAAITLLGLNQLNNNILAKETLHDIAASIGSDCPLFLEKKAVVMRGRGERIQAIEFPKKNIGVLLFKPFFSIETVDAYKLIRNNSENYLIEATAELCFKRFCDSLQQYPHKNINSVLYNNLETVVMRKYPIIEVLLQAIRELFCLPCAMSGSGSTCFLLYKKDEAPLDEIKRHIRNILGEKTFIAETTFL